VRARSREQKLRSPPTDPLALAHQRVTRATGRLGQARSTEQRGNSEAPAPPCDGAANGEREAREGRVHGTQRRSRPSVANDEREERSRKESKLQRFPVLVGDDVFFSGSAVQVLMEPRSTAVLEVLRWGKRGCDEWLLMLEDYRALELFVSDAGRDLCAAANKHGVARGADRV